MDTAIRKITVTEHADAAAQRTAATGEIVPNPHVQGTPEYAEWKAAFERFLLLHSTGEVSA